MSLTMCIDYNIPPFELVLAWDVRHVAKSQRRMLPHHHQYGHLKQNVALVVLDGWHYCLWLQVSW